MDHRRRQGFTLTELLIVIGIILVLMVIVTVGLRTVTDMSSRHETAAELKVCTDLLKEYQSINGLNGIEGPNANAPDAEPMKLHDPPWTNRWYPLPIYVDSPTETIGQIQGSALGFSDLAGSRTKHPGDPPTPGDFGDMSDKLSMNGPRWSSRAVYNTQGIMYVLLKFPVNRAIVSGLPSKRILETWPPNGPSDPPQAPFNLDAAVPLDGWGNPIIYVPRGGMHVWMNPTGGSKPQEYVVRTSGTYPVPPPSIGPNDRPFFASAGRDCYFTDLTKAADLAKATNPDDRAIDNLYSFQQQ